MNFADIKPIDFFSTKEEFNEAREIHKHFEKAFRRPLTNAEKESLIKGSSIGINDLFGAIIP